MSLSTGARLGPYELLGPLGSGGMGEVYKARDTRLDRTVAIKILHTDSEADRSARDRLVREARAISALTHPHICTLYDIGAHEGIDFLVMEHVEGETLAQRLARGALPIDQALVYAVQIASALDRAHSSGIMHRDIKPANVMLTRGGAKLLDFGLARPAPPVAGPSGDTLSVSNLTHSGFIVGTVQYMAPEQLEGRAVDARTDIFAFGALLYEMVSGRRAFAGDSAASVIASILEREPPRLTTIQPQVPSQLERIAAICLSKSPDERWQSARDLLRALELTVEPQRRIETANVGPAAPPRSVATAALAGAVAGAVLSVVGLMLSGWGLRDNAPAASRDLRFSVYPENGSEFVTAPASVVTPEFALSPDGTHLVFVGRSNGQAMLWLRPLSALDARVIPGTEGADYPFWAPDSASIGFFASGQLKTVSLAGGAPLVRGEASRDPRGGTWAADGAILGTLMSFSGVVTVAPDGAMADAIAVDRPAGESNHRWPWVLPDGKHFLYVVRSSNPASRGLTLAARGDAAGTRLVDTHHSAAFADGRVLFVRGRTLMAQTLDLAGRRLTGDALPVVDDVGLNTTGYSAFSVSQAGVLAYSKPWPVDGELTWFARDGTQLGAPITPIADYVSFSLSPDTRRLALSTVDRHTGTPDIWLLDLTRNSLERITDDTMTDANAFWSPDGTRLLFRSNRSGVNRVYERRVNDNRPEDLIDWGVRDEEMANMIISDYSRDGRHVILTNTGRATSFDVWRVTTAPSVEAVNVVATPFDEYHAVLSPDGKWLAYVSNISGAPQVYVLSFPEGDQRYQVSSQGGTEPQWRGDGRELFYLAGDQTLMAVSITSQPDFKIGLPAPLFRVRVPLMANPYRQQYVAAPDGQRFLVNTARAGTPPPAIHIISNWRALVERAQ